jgi:histidinol-phosphate aminotransferase
VIRAIKATASEVNRYPDGGCYFLKEALSETLGVAPERIVFGNGSDEIILITLRALVDPGDDVLVASPTFQIYHIAAMIKGAGVNVVPSKNYKYDLEGMLEAITPRTKLIFIANPDNPTGTYIPEKELTAFLSKIPDNILVFIDEAYYEFASGDDYPESLKYLENMDKKIVVARTFSKAYGLAGLRIGYGVTNKAIAEVFNKIREPFNVNSTAQAAALAALKDEKYMRDIVAKIKNEKKRYYDYFESMGIDFG